MGFAAALLWECESADGVAEGTVDGWMDGFCEGSVVGVLEGFLGRVDDRETDGLMDGDYDGAPEEVVWSSFRGLCTRSAGLTHHRRTRWTSRWCSSGKICFGIRLDETMQKSRWSGSGSGGLILRSGVLLLLRWLQ